MHGKLTLTPVTVALVVTNIVVLLVMLKYGAGLWHAPNDLQLAWGAGFGLATKDGEWWRLGSAMFLHFGLVHLAMNMWALWNGGWLVERLYDSSRCTFIYFVSGLTGNLASLIARATAPFPAARPAPSSAFLARG
ncbi:MAG: rhomboid family intramembrane serine protease [Burkholderiales bacterium]